MIYWWRCFGLFCPILGEASGLPSQKFWQKKRFCPGEVLVWLWRARLYIWFPWKECYIWCGEHGCAYYYPWRKCYIVCGEQKLYILLLMEECFSILVCYGLQRRNYGLYMCYFTHYTYLYIVMIFIIFKMCLKNIWYDFFHVCGSGYPLDSADTGDTGGIMYVFSIFM